MFLIQPFLSIGVPYIISVKLELDSVWNGGVQVFLGILGIAGGFVATAITGKFQIKNMVLVKKSVGNFLNQQQLPITDIFYAVPIAFLSDCAQG